MQKKKICKNPTKLELENSTNKKISKSQKSWKCKKYLTILKIDKLNGKCKKLNCQASISTFCLFNSRSTHRLSSYLGRLFFLGHHHFYGHLHFWGNLDFWGLLQFFVRYCYAAIKFMEKKKNSFYLLHM